MNVVVVVVVDVTGIVWVVVVDDTAGVTVALAVATLVELLTDVIHEGPQDCEADCVAAEGMVVDDTELLLAPMFC